RVLFRSDRIGHLPGTDWLPGRALTCASAARAPPRGLMTLKPIERNPHNKESCIPALFNHPIIASTDRAVSADFYRFILEADEAPGWGPFTNLTLAGGVMLQFAEPPVEIQMQHYAFLVDDALFDRAYARLVSHGIPHWADPQIQRPGACTPR